MMLSNGKVLYKSSGLSATIPVASYSEQSTRRILPGILSPSDRGVYPPLVLLNCYLERIMHETFNEQYTAISIGDLLVCSLRFADDIDLIGQQKRITRPVKPTGCKASAYSMVVSIERSNTVENKQHQCQCYHGW